MPTRPERLFETRCRIVGEAVDGLEPPTAMVPCTVDLDDIVGVRAVHDFDGDGRLGSTVVDTKHGGGYNVTSDYAAVRAAWRAYRAHADSMARPRN